MLIELFAIWSGGKAGYLYNVTLDGELVLDRSRDPACLPGAYQASMIVRRMPRMRLG